MWDWGGRRAEGDRRSGLGKWAEGCAKGHGGSLRKSSGVCVETEGSVWARRNQGGFGMSLDLWPGERSLCWRERKNETPNHPLSLSLSFLSPVSMSLSICYSEVSISSLDLCPELPVNLEVTLDVP